MRSPGSRWNGKGNCIQGSGVHRLGRRVSGGSWRECRGERGNWWHWRRKSRWFDPARGGLWLWIFSSSPCLLPTQNSNYYSDLHSCTILFSSLPTLGILIPRFQLLWNKYPILINLMFSFCTVSSI